VQNNERAMHTLNSPGFQAAVGSEAEEFLLFLSLRGQGRSSTSYGHLA
jgi:hypothetical protein